MKNKTLPIYTHILKDSQYTIIEWDTKSIFPFRVKEIVVQLVKDLTPAIGPDVVSWKASFYSPFHDTPPYATLTIIPKDSLTENDRYLLWQRFISLHCLVVSLRKYPRNDLQEVEVLNELHHDVEGLYP